MDYRNTNKCMLPMERETNIPAIPAYLHPGGRLLAKGGSALSNAELLAIILRTGTAHETAIHLAERILAHFNGLYGLAQANASDLQAVHDLSVSRIAEVIAVFELSKRLMRTPPTDRPFIHSAADAANYLADMGHLTQENVRVILLDSAKKVIATPTIYMGTVNMSVLRIAEIYREAIARNSPSIILAHNHPSGDPTPSPEDIELTRTLAAAGKLLDITLADHLIIGQQRWVSLREQGFLT